MLERHGGDMFSPHEGMENGNGKGREKSMCVCRGGKHGDMGR